MGLTKAKFKVGEDEISVHFNPSSYSITTRSANINADTDKSSSGEKRGLNVDGKSQETLDLSLHFDTYTKFGDLTDSSAEAREDVRKYSDKIVALTEVTNGKRQVVTFIWGSMSFEGTVESVVQKYTMFMDDGRPVRAELTVKMNSASASRSAALTDGAATTWIDWSADWKSELAQKAKSKGGNVRELLDD